MGRKSKRKKASSTAGAGSSPETVMSEAIEPSSRGTIRATEKKPPLPLDSSSTKQVKQDVNKISQSMLIKLYNFCTRRPKANEELSVVVSMFGVHLNRRDIYTMKPKGWVSNMVILAAGKIMMEEEKETNGTVTRHIFSPQFMNKVKCDLNLSNEDSHKTWCIDDVSVFILPSKLGYEIYQCKLIFAPTIFEEHWSCYVLEPKDKTLYVLDSMHDKFSTSKKNLDDATKRRFEELLVLMNPGSTKENVSITLVYADVPRQKNIHDCGIYVLKYMEIWDGSVKWQDKTMPDYEYKEMVQFRQSLLCGWVQHPRNEVREEILKAAGVWGKLS
ncbi:putative ubiquitin-like-specific protease 1B isoform X1 [Vigna unguiculata]|uniref:putative ubiquitin-like-specific protease 1B isoform X1 n=2 Tax=Vigna unguiculata TaxID=3917 RepID=UPI001016842B|nr:putative ubiquitin-like-specific protease 1B isoform X1 [Vigna unguiculata]